MEYTLMYETFSIKFENLKGSINIEIGAVRRIVESFPWKKID
jgi:hypothetical protein